MAWARLVVAVVLALLLGAAAWMLWPAQPDAPELPVAVQVVLPNGDLRFDGVVHVAEATALEALLAAAEVGGFEVEVDGLGGPCTMQYVRAVAGHEARGQAGWLYAVRGPEDARAGATEADGSGRNSTGDADATDGPGASGGPDGPDGPGATGGPDGTGGPGATDAPATPWTYPVQSAGCHVLEPGAALRWEWTDRPR